VASALPTDSVSLTAIKSQQQSIAVEIENQIAENTIIKIK